MKFVTRQWLFLVVGLIFAVAVLLLLPSGTFWKDAGALMLVAMVALSLYPFRRR